MLFSSPLKRCQRTRSFFYFNLTLVLWGAPQFADKKVAEGNLMKSLISFYLSAVMCC